MQNNVSKINFTSNIRFVPYPRYVKLAGNPKTISVGEMYKMEHVQDIEGLGSTDGIRICLAGTMNLLKKSISKIFHWYPKELFKHHALSKERLKAISNNVENIEDIDKYKIFAIGGVSKGFPGQNFSSLRCLGFFKSKLKKVKPENITLFFAQNTKGAKDWKQTPRSAFVYSEKNDTYYVNCQKFIYNAPEDPNDHTGYWKDLLDKNEIKEHFGLIIASPKDKFFTENNPKVIPHTFWEE